MRTQRKRPIVIRITIWLALGHSAVNLWRLFGLIQQRSVLQAFSASSVPDFMLIMALLWTIFFAVGTVLIVGKQAISRAIIPVFFLCYGLFQSLAPILAKTSLAHLGWQLTLIYHLFLFGLILFLLNVPAARAYFRPALKTNNQ